jgi:hypothetical protein
MELGATVCLPRNFQPVVPASGDRQARIEAQAQLPIKLKRTSAARGDDAAIVERAGKLLAMAE